MATQIASITKAVKGLDKAINRGTVSAFNKALVSAKATLVSKIADGTNLKRADIVSRIWAIKATPDSLSISLAIATLYQMGLRKFSPLLKNVRVTPKNRNKAQVYQGVTVSLGNDGRQLVDGGFVLDKPYGLIVVGRQGDAKYPTQELKTDIFQKVALDASASTKDDMTTRFNEIAEHEIEFAIQSKFDTGE